MTTTDDLIAQLSARVEPVRPHAAAHRLAGAVGLGALIAFLVMLLGLGLRPDMAAASATPPFWIKWAFTLSLTGAAFAVVRRLGRPEGRMGAALWGVLAIFAAVGLLGLGEWLATSPADRMDLVLGHTALRCSVAIPLLAVPVFFALLRAFAKLAPTRLALTGAMTGLLSAALGATVYAFACPEHAAAFMAVWYGVGMAVSAGLGALAGPRLLKW